MHYEAFVPKPSLVCQSRRPDSHRSSYSKRFLAEYSMCVGFWSLEHPEYALTNVTEPFRKYESSRGDLTSSFLLPKDPKATLQAEIDEFLLENRGRSYAGFNLLLLSPAPAPPGSDSGTLSLDGAFATNSGGGGPITARMLTKGERQCGGISNGVDHHGANEWPKVKHGIQTLHEVLNSLPQDATEAEIVERLFALLTLSLHTHCNVFRCAELLDPVSWKSEHAPIDRSELRNTILVDPLLVQTKESSDEPCPNYYGTRLSTVILIRRDGTALFIERDVWTLDDKGCVARGDPGRDRIFRFQIEPDRITS
ncbi:hypothetical protein ACG7TL_006226 [Trametes sanguinea]